ncbi:MAG: DUF2336 domain-containing protein [Rhodospirillaceae bacterium]|nr:DUF2336 domain-containing protein [Rhodospirillaceae bacterium]MBT5667415.1 DUF2336 domain-containing protein [Rhodospirillaceae bacterium]
MPPEIDSDALLELARNNTAGARSELIENITAFPLADHNAMSDHERSLLYDILNSIVHDAEMSVRLTMSACLAELPDAPRDLVRLLANDAIDIAYPILTKSGVLQDEDLLEIIRNRTMEHQLAISVRRAISEDVSAGLVETANENVIGSLLRNQDASISRQTMEYLVEESKRFDSFQEPILRRRELDPELVTRMFAWVSGALRQSILDDWDLDPGVVDSLLQRAVSREIQATAYAAADIPKSAQLANTLVDADQVDPVLMLKTLQDGEIALFIAMFTSLTKLDGEFAKRLLFEPSGDRMAVVCKASGIGKAIFTSIFALTRLTRPSDEEMEAAMGKSLIIFNKTSRSQAMETMRHWKKASRDAAWTQR